MPATKEQNYQVQSTNALVRGGLSMNPWVSRTTNDLLLDWTSVCWSPTLGMFCAVSSDGGAGSVVTSYDGITWTPVELKGPNQFANNWVGVCWAETYLKFLAVSSSSIEDYARIEIAGSGITGLSLRARDKGEAGNDITATVGASGGYQYIEISNGLTGQIYSTDAAYSNDDGYTGQTGTAGVTGNIKFAISRFCDLATVEAGADVYTNELATGTVQFEGGIDNAQILSSSDGETWVNHNLPTEREWTSIAAGFDGQMQPVACIVSKSGHVAMCSDDLDQWDESVGGGYRYNAVCWSSDLGYFLAVGSPSRVVKIEIGSPPTLTESENAPLSPAADIYWKGVCWSTRASNFFAVCSYEPGENYSVAFSSDGAIWEYIAPKRAGDWTSITSFPDIGNTDLPGGYASVGLLFATGNELWRAPIIHDGAGGSTEVAVYTNGGRVGQTFLSPDKGGTHIETVTLKIKLSATSVETNDMVVEIWTVAAGIPSSLVGTSSTIGKNTLTTDYQAVEFIIGELAIVQNTVYALVLRVLGAAYTQYPIVEIGNPGDYSNGTLLTYANSIWTIATAKDLQYFSIAYIYVDSASREFHGSLTCYEADIYQMNSRWTRRSLGGFDYDFKSAAYAPTLKRICVVGGDVIKTQNIVFDMESIFANINTIANRFVNLDSYAAELLEVEADTANITGDVFGITGQAYQLNGIKTLQVGANFNGGSELDVYDEGTLHDISHSVGATGSFSILSGTKVAQDFTTPNIGGVKVSTITLRIKLSASSIETNNMYVDVYNVDNAQGRPGTLLGSSSAVNKNTLTTEYQDVVFNLGGLALTKATMHALVFRVDGAHTQLATFDYTDGVTSYHPGAIWFYSLGSWNDSGGTYDLSHFDIAFTFVPTSSWDTDDGPAPITVNWAKFTRVGFVCFIDLSITWGSQTAAQIAAPVSLTNLPFDGENGFIQFLSMDEARDTEAYSVYYTHTPYIYNTDLYFKKSEDMLIQYDDSPEPLAIPNGLAGRTTRISGFYFVA